MRKNLFLLGLLLTSLVGCNKQTGMEKPDNATSNKGFTALYTAIDEPATKRTEPSVTYTAKWEDGDEIAIVVVSGTNSGRIDKYGLVPEYANKEAGVFEPSGSYDDFAADDILVAVYPFSSASFSGGNLYVTLEKDVEYVSTSNIPAFNDNDIQVSSQMTKAQFEAKLAADTPLSFHRIVACVTVTCNMTQEDLLDEKVNKVTFVHSGISGKAQVQFSAGVPSVAVNTGDEDYVEISMTSKPFLTSVNYSLKFIPVFPCSMGTGFAFVYDTDNYEVGFYRKFAGEMGTTYNFQSFGLYEGAYTQVSSEENATFDKSWWYNYKEFSGEFTGDGASMGGSTAGQFTE